MKRFLLLSLLAAALLLPRGAAARPDGVTLYSGTSRSGERISLDRDVFDLNETPFGARRTNSIDVSRGCRVTLYERSGFRGRSQEFFEKDNDLGNTRLGRDSVSSVRVDCRGGASGSGRPRGVTLYRDSELSGPSQAFDGDVPDLEATRFGARRASSIEVPPGCMAILYSEVDFRGRSTTFREDNRNLRGTPVGNDTASSLRVDCGGPPRRTPAPLRTATPRPLVPAGPPPVDVVPAGVTLFVDKSYRGASETFAGDVPDLSRTRVGGRSASSLRVPPGCRATLFSEPGFAGRSTVFEGDNGDLRNTPVGNDAARSIRVECGRQGY